MTSHIQLIQVQLKRGLLYYYHYYLIYFRSNGATDSVCFSSKVPCPMDGRVATLDTSFCFENWLVVVYIGMLCLITSIISLLFVMELLILAITISMAVITDKQLYRTKRFPIFCLVINPRHESISLHSLPTSNLQ